MGKNPFFDSYFGGLIDNVFVFDVALTDTQINSIRLGGEAAILAAVPEPGTAVWGLGLVAESLLRRRRNGATAG